MSTSPEGVTFVMPSALHSQPTPTLTGCNLVPAQSPMSHPLGLQQQTEAVDTPHSRGNTEATPLLTWNPAYMDITQAISDPGMDSEAVRLPSALELAMTATIAAQPDLLEAAVSVQRSASATDQVGTVRDLRCHREVGTWKTCVVS